MTLEDVNSLMPIFITLHYKDAQYILVYDSGDIHRHIGLPLLRTTALSEDQWRQIGLNFKKSVENSRFSVDFA